jgi:hypothetical protein
VLNKPVKPGKMRSVLSHLLAGNGNGNGNGGGQDSG